MVRIYNPPHRGEILADTVLREDGGMSLTEFAKRLNVSRVALSRVVNGRTAVSAELAIRLAAALGGSAESWLHMQATTCSMRRRSGDRGSSRLMERLHEHRGHALGCGRASAMIRR
jgi:antitoxin HigA-1